MKTISSRFGMKRLRKVPRGMKTKLSWLTPKVEPTFSATPTTVKLWPPTVNSLPMGSTEGKSLSTMSWPMKQTRVLWR